jgi:hypothetical protein
MPGMIRLTFDLHRTQGLRRIRLLAHMQRFRYFRRMDLTRRHFLPLHALNY